MDAQTWGAVPALVTAVPCFKGLFVYWVVHTGME